MSTFIICRSDYSESNSSFHNTLFADFNGYIGKYKSKENLSLFRWSEETMARNRAEKKKIVKNYHDKWGNNMNLISYDAVSELDSVRCNGYQFPVCVTSRGE